MGRALLVAVVLGLAPPAHADAPLFVWVDKAGALHATDRLQDVPEPFYGMYAAQLKEREKAAGGAGAPPPPAPAEAPARTNTPSGAPFAAPLTAADLASSRQNWKELVAHWRLELAQATAELQKIDGEMENVQGNPVLRLLPTNQERIQVLMPLRTLAQDRVEKARRHLVDEIPKRARAQGVPPQWLL